MFSLHSLVLAEEQYPYTPNGTNQEGKELLFIYLGATDCAPCQLLEVKAAVLKAKGLLATRAAREGYGFSAIGVALDFDLQDGIKFLEPVGPFDETIVGRLWHNSGVLGYMIKHRGARLGIPQILVMVREVHSKNHSLWASDPKVVGMALGTGIPAWVEAGARIDLGDAGATKKESDKER